MLKNKFFNLINYVLFGFITLGLPYGLAFADSINTLPDNVKITTSNDGSSTTIVIDSKPGYSTNVETSCVNGKCTHNTVSKKVDEAEVKAQIKKQQEYWNNFWKQQEEYFKVQEKMFQNLWNMSF